jgi:hypothetical protein
VELVLGVLGGAIVLAAATVGLAILVAMPPRRLVRRIVGENGEIYNPFFRFVSRYIVGHHRTIDGYLRALRAETETAPA